MAPVVPEGDRSGEETGDGAAAAPSPAAASGRFVGGDDGPPPPPPPPPPSGLLREWAAHDDASYHDLSPTEAAAIRSALLDWYRANRRRLPWRGDAPPYDGSTAGINNRKGANGGGGSKERGKRSASGSSGDGKRQKSMSDFFASSKGKGAAAEAVDKNGRNTNTTETGTDDNKGEARPVTAYGVWVSEIMLQQTRVEAVIPYYLKWMKSFPTVQALAEASEDEVNSHWAGLGFYRRARMLHSGAKLVVSEFNGTVPSAVEDLLKITGIGRYTACAIASIAHGACVPVVDGNVCRVLSRLRGIAQHIKAPALKDDGGWRLAGQIVSAGGGGRAGEVNQALMELGATHCSPSGSGTDRRDPLREFYLSTEIGRGVVGEIRGGDILAVEDLEVRAVGARGRRWRCAFCDEDGVSSVLRRICEDLSPSYSATSDAAAAIGHRAFPIPPPHKAKRQEVLAVAALCRKAESKERTSWLLVRRPEQGLLAGQWEFPNVCIWSSNKGKAKTTKKKKGNADGEVDVPIIDAGERRAALDSFLCDISIWDSESDDSPLDISDQDGLEFLCPRMNIGTPIDHVFSHVRHTMWVEYGEVVGCTGADDSGVSVWRTLDGREVRWMTEGNMDEVGITSGVRKVLDATKKSLCLADIGGKKNRRRGS